jgi:choline/glycine/proline betaine transport protein
MQSAILARFGWLYLLAVGIFLFSMILLAFGRYGALKLGPDDAEPDFHYLSWMAMLFAAGMGIGLMYFAVGEPMTHFAAPPEAAPLSIAAQREAMSVTFFHWGVHAWAVYAVVGLSLAYFGYRYNLPLTVRSGLYPLLKEGIHGPIGHAVDIFAICGTLFGLATSLGLRRPADQCRAQLLARHPRVDLCAARARRRRHRHRHHLGRDRPRQGRTHPE